MLNPTGFIRYVVVSEFVFYIFQSHSLSHSSVSMSIDSIDRSSKRVRSEIEEDMHVSESFEMTVEEEDDDVDIDLFQDLFVVSCQSKGSKETDCEDRVIDKFKIPMDFIGSSASCVMLGCMDGHGGSVCVDYVQKQLPVSILSVIRNPTKRKSTDSENLQAVIRKAFQVTDNNFLHVCVVYICVYMCVCVIVGKEIRRKVWIHSSVSGVCWAGSSRWSIAALAGFPG